MPLSEIPRIGLLFTSFVEFVVVLSALALVVFLLRRWHASDGAMRAYFVFWTFTLLVWTTSMIRYLLVAFGYEKSNIEHLLSISTQIFVFISGPVLFYFVGKRILKMKSPALFIPPIASLLLTVWSFVLLMSPNGINTPNINYFSADSVISSSLFYIFGVEIVILLSLLMYDVVLHFRVWYKSKIVIEKYQAFHSLALILYLTIGTIDQSKVFIGWPLVVFRMFYSASFLFVYIVVSRYEINNESYLLTKEIGKQIR